MTTANRERERERERRKKIVEEEEEDRGLVERRASPWLSKTRGIWMHTGVLRGIRHGFCCAPTELDGKCCPEDFAISKKTSVKYVLYFVELCLCCSRGVSLHMCMLHSAIVASMHACMLHSAIVAIACILSSALFSSQEVHVALAQQSYQLPL